MKKSMFVMRRPGVLVVSGTITDIQDNVVVSGKRAGRKDEMFFGE